MSTDQPSGAVGRYVILGAGVAGLAAAWRLLQLKPGSKVVIVEKDTKTGGLAAGWKQGDFKADLGPHRIYTELPEIEALLPELIATDQVLTVPRRSELYLRGHYYRYPVRITELMQKMGLATFARLGFGAALGKARAVVAPASATYRDAMEKAFGRGLFGLIVGPYSEKVWKTDPDRLSPEIARVRVSAGNAAGLLSRWFSRGKGKPSALSSFTYVKGGVESLVATLVEKVESHGGEVRLGCTVEELRISDVGRVTGVAVTCAGRTEELFADAVISTVPLPELVTMTSRSMSDTGAVTEADDLKYLGLILVGLVVNRPQATPNSWLYFPEKHLVFNRAYEPRNFDPGMAPSDKSLLVFEVTSRWDAAPWTQSDAEIIEQVRADIQQVDLFKPDEVGEAFCLRVPHAYPLYAAGYEDNLSVIFKYLEKIPNLVSTGRQGLFNHNNMDHSMLMGIRSAETVAASGAPAGDWYPNLGQFASFRIVD